MPAGSRTAGSGRGGSGTGSMTGAAGGGGWGGPEPDQPAGLSQAGYRVQDRIKIDVRVAAAGTGRLRQGELAEAAPGPASGRDLEREPRCAGESADHEPPGRGVERHEAGVRRAAG